jgi:hypothetical protein
MFDDFKSGPRNWKWMVPAALVSPLAVWFGAWWGKPGWSEWAVVPLCMAGILSVATVVNLWLYAQRRWADVYADVQVVRNSTPEVRMMEAAKGMHPDAVKALLVHRRTIWRIKYIPKRDTVDWILDEAPTVHAGFVDFVLDHSNHVSLMAKHGLSEGSTKFDPDGIVTDYQQYDDLLWLMQQKLMVTQAFGNQAPHFLPPWNVELLQRRFGLDGEGYQVDDEMSDAMRQVMKEQRTPLPSASPQMRESTEFGGKEKTPDVIAKALEGLEQTQEMRARFRLNQ